MILIDNMMFGTCYVIKIMLFIWILSAQSLTSVAAFI